MLPKVNLIRGDETDYLVFATHDLISMNLSLSGGWGEHFRTISKMFYQDVASPLILDIGANLGAYCVPIGTDIAAAGGQIYAYEPQRIVFYQLCGNIFLNRLDNVFAFQQAIGETDGVVRLPAIDYAKSKNVGGFSLDADVRMRTSSIATAADGLEADTPVLRLDSLSFPRTPCLIKIDVEGLELEVLRGGVGFLRNSGFPPILLEAWNLEWFAERRKALVAFLGELGYELFCMGEDVVAQHPAYHRQIRFKLVDNVISMERLK